MAHPLPLTGERTLPGVRGEEYWFARHLAAYRWITTRLAPQLAQTLVVEAGSGEGYGAAALKAAGARCVVALDYDAPTLAHAHAAYPEVASVRANLAQLPLRPQSIDVVVCLQVIEHLWDLRGFLAAVRSVLRPGGIAVMSTPNRPVFSPGLARGERPTNPFHVEELDAVQLRDLLLAAGLVDVELHGLHHGARLTAWEQRAGTGLVAAQISALSGTSVPRHDLEAMVESITADDFAVAGPDDAHDLVAVAVRP